MTVSFFADSKFAVLTLFFVSHAVRIFITCKRLVDFRRSNNTQCIQKLRNMKQTYKKTTEKRRHQMNVYHCPRRSSKKPPKRSKIRLLTLSFVRMNWKRRPSFRVLQRNILVQIAEHQHSRKYTSEITEVYTRGFRKVMPPLKYSAQVVWPEAVLVPTCSVCLELQFAMR